MKKLFCVFLVMALVAGLVGCGSNEPAASERNINIATRAVEIVDEFLDGAIRAGVAHDRVNELAEIDTTNTKDVRVDQANHRLSTDLLLLRTDLSRAAWEDTTENYNRVLERRNALAERVGIDAR